MIFLEIFVCAAMVLLSGEILSILISIPGILLTSAFAVLRRSKDLKEILAWFLKAFTIVSGVLLLGFLAVFWYFKLWEHEFGRYFRSPIVVIILVWFFVLVFDNLNDGLRKIPIRFFNLKNQNLKTLIALTIVTIFYSFNGAEASSWILQIGVSAGIIAAVYSFVVTLGAQSNTISEVSLLNEKIEKIEDQIEKFYTVSFVVAYTTGDLRWRDKIDSLVGLLAQLKTDAESNNVTSAKAKFQQAEVASNILQTQFNLILNEGFVAKLRIRLESQIDELHLQQFPYSFTGQEISDFERLREKAMEISGKMESTNFIWDFVDHQFIPILSFIQELQNLQSGLEFYEAVGKAFSKYENQVVTCRYVCSILQVLGMDNQAFLQAINHWENKVRYFRQPENQNIDEISKEYVELQALFESLTKMHFEAKAKISETWVFVEVKRRISVFVPKYCSSSKTSNGYIIVNNRKSEAYEIKVSLEALNVTLESSPNYTLQIKEGVPFKSESFKIRGNGVGTDDLIVKIQFDDLNVHKRSLQITNIPNAIQLFDKTSAIVLVICTGITFAPICLLGATVRDSGIIASSIGAAFSSLIFGVRYYREIASKKKLLA